MNRLFVWLVPYTPFVMIVCAYIAVFSGIADANKMTKKDCAIAEFSPDFSVKEKELCRKQRES